MRKALLKRRVTIYLLGVVTGLALYLSADYIHYQIYRINRIEAFLEAFTSHMQ